MYISGGGGGNCVWGGGGGGGAVHVYIVRGRLELPHRSSKCRW